MATPINQYLTDYTEPIYPTFRRLKLEHKQIFDDFNAHFLPYSDFNFTSLFCWNTDESTEFSFLQGNLVIRQPDYVTGEPTLSLLGKNQVDECLLALLQSNDNLKLVPKTTIDAVSDLDQFTATNDRDNHDYIYDLGEITDLAGKKFKKIRNKVNAFTTEHGQTIDVTSSAELTSQDKEEFLALFDIWTTTATQSVEDSANERIAVYRLIENASVLNLLFTTIRQGPTLVAFSINEILANQYAICHFEKAILIDSGIFLFVAHEAAKALLDKNATHINWEQDLGIDGLRNSKMKWQPTNFLEKYSVTLRDSTHLVPSDAAESGSVVPKPNSNEQRPLPTFPNFESLDLCHRSATEELTQNTGQYSDFNFTNLFIWNIDQSTTVSALNGNLIVRIMNYTGDHLVLTLDGTNKITETVEAVLEYAKTQPDLGQKLEYVHENIIDELAHDNRFVIAEERHNFDYIIQLSEETNLSGRANKSRRKLIRHFENTYAEDTEITIVDVHQPAIQNQMIDLFNLWAKDKKLPESDIHDERMALERLFLVANDKIQATAIYNKQALIGFTLDELNENGCAIGHFMKADINYRGIFQYLEYHAGLHLMQRGMEYLNIEQDLGIEQLRESKLGHHPYKLLKKFSISR